MNSAEYVISINRLVNLNRTPILFCNFFSHAICFVQQCKIENYSDKKNWEKKVKNRGQPSKEKLQKRSRQYYTNLLQEEKTENVSLSK